MKKICPVCNIENEPSELFCIKCMADISAVQSGPAQAAKDELEPSKTGLAEAHKKKQNEPMPSHGLFLIFQGKKLAVLNGDVFGRTSKGKEILKQFPGVSREHAEFIFQNGRWFVKDHGSSNGTFLNAERIPELQLFEIKSGDRLGFSRKVEFEIKLESEVNED
ncbi:hypothetical protein MASR1M12_31520 [Erysipelotrichia bacterium]